MRLYAYMCETGVRRLSHRPYKKYSNPKMSRIFATFPPQCQINGFFPCNEGCVIFSVNFSETFKDQLGWIIIQARSQHHSISRFGLARRMALEHPVVDQRWFSPDSRDLIVWVEANLCVTWWYFKYENVFLLTYSIRRTKCSRHPLIWVFTKENHSKKINENVYKLAGKLLSKLLHKILKWIIHHYSEKFSSYWNFLKDNLINCSRLTDENILNSMSV